MFKSLIDFFKGGIEALRLFIEDLDRYAYMCKLPKYCAPLMLFIFPQTWAIGTYRIGHWIYKSKLPKFIKYPLLVFYYIIKRITEILTCIEISHRAEIDEGLWIFHRCVVIGENAKIGKYATIYHGVVIGRGEKYSKKLKIGDRVFFGTGCVVIGDINVGNDVAIGANAVVIKDVPDNARVAGVPAKVINYKGSKNFVIYRKR